MAGIGYLVENINGPETWAKLAENTTIWNTSSFYEVSGSI